MLLSKFGRSLECREHFPLGLLPIGGSRVLDAIFRPLHLLCLGSKAGILVPRCSLSASICLTNRQILQQLERVDPSQRVYACLLRRVLSLQLRLALLALRLAWLLRTESRAGAGAAKPSVSLSTLLSTSLHFTLRFCQHHSSLYIIRVPLNLSLQQTTIGLFDALSTRRSSAAFRKRVLPLAFIAMVILDLLPSFLPTY